MTAAAAVRLDTCTLSGASQRVMPGRDAHTDQLDRSTLLERLLLRRPRVMGILNVTPDSFSDGGRFFDPEAAVAHARELIAQGADILDIGAESTRPYGAPVPVPFEEEIRRLEAVLPLAVSLGVPVSLDTMKAEVAEWALSCGAAMINDVWGLQRDPDLASVIAQAGAPVIIMHNRQQVDASLDIMADIAAFFDRSLEIAAAHAIDRQNIVLDPGIGFGKTPEQSLIALARLAELQAFELPLLVGASRKRFIAEIASADPDRRLGGSIAAHLIAVANGANIVRVHDVHETVQALRVATAIRSAG
jgi:dihydropteroate synthase